MAEHGNVFYAVAHTQPTLIFPKGDSEAPVQLVLTPPVFAHGLGKLRSLGREAGEIEALRDGSLPGQGARGVHPPNTAQSRPPHRLQLGIEVRTDPRIPRLPPPMPLLGLFILLALEAVSFGLRSRDKKAFDCLLQRGVMAFEGQHLVGPLCHNLLGKGALTTQRVNRLNAPLERQEGQSRGARSALVRLGVPVALPQHHPFSVAHALTMGMARLAVPCAKERRNALPSIATTAPGVTAATACLQRRKQPWNCTRASRRKTRLKVSWEGSPAGNSRNCRSHSSRSCPKSSRAGYLSAPHRTAQTALTKMSLRLCPR